MSKPIHYSNGDLKKFSGGTTTKYVGRPEIKRAIQSAKRASAAYRAWDKAKDKYTDVLSKVKEEMINEADRIDFDRSLRVLNKNLGGDDLVEALDTLEDIFGF